MGRGQICEIDIAAGSCPVGVEGGPLAGYIGGYPSVASGPGLW
jgi:hypothetical protein